MHQIPLCIGAGLGLTQSGMHSRPATKMGSRASARSTACLQPVPPPPRPETRTVEDSRLVGDPIGSIILSVQTLLDLKRLGTHPQAMKSIPQVLMECHDLVVKKHGQDDAAYALPLPGCDLTGESALLLSLKDHQRQLSVAKRSLQEADSRLEDSLLTINMLKEENQRCRSTLRESETNELSLKQQFLNASGRANELSTELTRERAKFSKLQQQVTAMSRFEDQRLLDRTADLRSELEQLRDQLRSTEEAGRTNERELAGSKSEISELETKIHTSTKEVDELTERVAGLTSDLNAAHTEVITKNTVILNLEQSVASLTADLGRTQPKVLFGGEQVDGLVSWLDGCRRFQLQVTEPTMVKASGGGELHRLLQLPNKIVAQPIKIADAERLLGAFFLSLAALANCDADEWVDKLKSFLSTHHQPAKKATAVLGGLHEAMRESQKTAWSPPMPLVAEAILKRKLPTVAFVSQVAPLVEQVLESFRKQWRLQPRDESLGSAACPSLPISEIWVALDRALEANPATRPSSFMKIEPRLTDVVPESSRIATASVNTVLRVALSMDTPGPTVCFNTLFECDNHGRQGFFVSCLMRLALDRALVYYDDMCGLVAEAESDDTLPFSTSFRNRVAAYDPGRADLDELVNAVASAAPQDRPAHLRRLPISRNLPRPERSSPPPRCFFVSPVTREPPPTETAFSLWQRSCNFLQ